MTTIEPEGAAVATAHHACRDNLPMWTIYANPLDRPGKHVARMFLALPRAVPTRLAIVADTLEEVRAALPPGLFCIGRSPEDEPQIVEVWL